MEEYLSSFSYTEQDKESLQDGMIDDFTIEKESDPSRIVIGSDDRTRIYSVNSYPFSATAYIIATFPGGVTAEGSGFFVGPDVVVTAGHGLYSKDYGWATSATVYPGGLYSSFGCTVSYDLNVHSYFYALDLSSYDVGIIKLSSTFGNGSFGLSTVSDYNLNNDNIILYGYPGYPFASGALFYSTGTVLNVYSNQFEHDADASEGESGSPIVRNYTQFTATGIHSGTAETYNNCAVRITAGLIQYINSFM
jgi:glutamyl endopeptidase